MNFIDKLLGINEHIIIKKEILEGLFKYAKKTLAALVVVELLFLFLFLPQVGNILYVWFGASFVIIVSRFYDAYYFEKDPERYPLTVWYRKFIVKAWLTALFFSLMMLYSVHKLNVYDQLFLFTILLGVTGGAVNSLSSDQRIALGYLGILLLPLSLEMIFFVTQINSLIIGFLLLVYFSTLVSVVLQASAQKKMLEKRKEEIKRVESELYEKEEMLELFFDQAPVGIFLYNTEYIITDTNQAFLELFGRKKEEMIGFRLENLPDQSPIEPLQKALTEGPQSYIGPYRSVNGELLWVEAKTSPIYNSAHEIIGGIVLIENKTKEHNALEELQYSALHDSLTSLTNRRGFKKYMEKMISQEKHSSYYSALFYLDLNQFKQVNDSLGHAMGDKVLVAIAKRLTNQLEDAENITRLGGDEFIIVVPFIDTELERTKGSIESHIQSIQKIFDDPFMIDGVRLHMKSSIGIVIIEPGFDNIEEIVRYADISMYQAKRHGQDFISYYNMKLDEERRKVFDLQHQLVAALRNNELKLYFQPIVQIGDNTIVAAEALIRWEHPQNGLMGADAFIPIAIESGIIVDIGWWVIEQVCRQIAAWKEKGLWTLSYLSININAKQLLKNDFAEVFIGKLEQYGVESSDIKIEITETSLIDNFNMTQEVILTLQRYGIGCAIDDFGTGYSSLSYLKKLSFSILKIDKEFMDGLEKNRETRKLVHTMIDIGKQFDYAIVVEGIENTDQKEIIQKIDDSLCYQGYLFSRPVAKTEFEEKFLR